MTVDQYRAVGFTDAQAQLLALRDLEARAISDGMSHTLDAILAEMRRGFSTLDQRLVSIDDRVGRIEAQLRDSPGRN